jgi:hypothetical protein
LVPRRSIAQNPKEGLRSRRALQLLASSPYGAAEALMLGHSFSRRMLAGLVRAGLAAAECAGDKTIEVVRIEGWMSLQPRQIRPCAFLRDLHVTLHGIIADHIGMRIARLAGRHRGQLRARSVEYGVIGKQNIGA